MYLVRTLFKDLERAKAVFPLLRNDPDKTDVNNIVESFHNFLKHWSDRRVALLVPVIATVHPMFGHCVSLCSCVRVRSSRWAGVRHGSRRLPPTDAVECVFNAHTKSHVKYHLRSVTVPSCATQEVFVSCLFDVFTLAHGTGLGA